MIRRIVEYVAADRALARATIADLADRGATESIRWTHARRRLIFAGVPMSNRMHRNVDRFAAWWNKRIWVQVRGMQEQAAK